MITKLLVGGFLVVSTVAFGCIITVCVTFLHGEFDSYSWVFLLSSVCVSIFVAAMADIKGKKQTAPPSDPQPEIISTGYAIRVLGHELLKRTGGQITQYERSLLEAAIAWRDQAWDDRDEALGERLRRDLIEAVTGYPPATA